MPTLNEPGEPPATIDTAFNRIAARTPGALAFIEDRREVTYSELDRHAEGIAATLRRNGIGKGSRVAVTVDLSSATVASLLGTMRAGAAFVPVDATLPPARQMQLLDDLRPSVLLVSQPHLQMRGFRGPAIHAWDEADVGGATNASDIETQIDTVPADRECGVLYTSGSTGIPKGVLVPSVAVMGHFQTMWSAFPLGPGDVAIAYRPCATVAAIWEHFGALLQGVPTVMVSHIGTPDPLAVVRRAAAHGVSHMSGSPSFWQAVLAQPGAELAQWGTLRLGITSGEIARMEFVRAWRRLFPLARLLNVYGTTECIRPCIADISDLPDHEVTVPVGRPVANVTVAIRNEDCGLIADGEVGEVCVTGPCVANGYLNLPELTRARFIAGADGQRTYRTGDLGRRRSDGAVEILGRVDDQVNVRGHRVELGDVEAALRLCDEVLQAAVVARPGPDGDLRLVGYAVARTAGALPWNDIRASLRSRLPDHMIPTEWMQVETIPLTVSGKIDRQSLPAPVLDRLSLNRTDAARSALDRRVAEIVANVMSLESVGISDHFLELGGHSLAAIQIVARILDEFEVEIPLESFFAADLTVGDVIAAIEGELKDKSPHS